MNRWFILPYVLGCALAVLFGMVSFFDNPNIALFGVLLFWSVGLVFLIGILWKETINRPLFVILTDEGVLLKLRGGRIVGIEWGDILWVYASPGGKEGTDGILVRCGNIKTSKVTFYQVTYEIGRDIKDRHRQINGIWPPDRLHHIENSMR